jgi:hypothetical protein
MASETSHCYERSVGQTETFPMRKFLFPPILFYKMYVCIAFSRVKEKKLQHQAA